MLAAFFGEFMLIYLDDYHYILDCINNETITINDITTILGTVSND